MLFFIRDDFFVPCGLIKLLLGFNSPEKHTVESTLKNTSTAASLL